MSKLCKHRRFQYWHHFVYTTLLITPYSLLQATRSLAYSDRPALVPGKQEKQVEISLNSC
jgi:hypothetical protein